MIEVKLSSCGNPDFRQYAPISPSGIIQVSTLKEASEKCRQYIASWDLGGGNWNGGQVLKDGKLIAKISYNGRIWDLKDKEIILERRKYNG